MHARPRGMHFTKEEPAVFVSPSSASVDLSSLVGLKQADGLLAGLGRPFYGRARCFWSTRRGKLSRLSRLVGLKQADGLLAGLGIPILTRLFGVSPGPSGPGQGAALWLWGRRGLLLCFPSTRLPRGRTMPILGGGWSALCRVLRPKVQRPRARGFPRAQLGSKAGTGPAKP